MTEQLRSTAEGSNDETMPFLDLIVCPRYDVAYKADVMENLGLTKSGYRRKGQFNPAKNYNNSTSLQEVFNLVTYDVHELILKVRFEGKHWGKIEETLNKDKNMTEHLDITTKYRPTLGKCYSIRPRSHLIKLEIAIIDIVAKNSIYVYMGYPGQYMYDTKTKVS